MKKLEEMTYEELLKLNEEYKIKARKYDELTNKKGVYNLDEVCKMYGFEKEHLIEKLTNKKVLCTKKVEATAKSIDRGYTKLIFNDSLELETFITPKGLVYIEKLLKKGEI